MDASRFDRMAKLFDSHQRIVPTWLAAARYLRTQPNGRASNVILEISDPLSLTDDDREVIARVDAVLRADLTVRTAAGTIFPQDMYRRFGRPAFYEKYLEMLKRGKKPGWGTYALRMIEYTGRDSYTRLNPLETIVKRLSPAGTPTNARGREIEYRSAYELSFARPAHDLGAGDDLPQDLPIYDAAIDGARWYGGPCLSHVSFKRAPSEGGAAIDMTALYRSHHYCERALGNLIGLSWLLRFVATESGHRVGTLTCVSTDAVLVPSEWGGVAAVGTVLG